MKSPAPSLSLPRVAWRSAVHYRRTGLAVAAAVAIATAVITGSLLVGASVSGSVRDAALARLGRIDHALVAPRFFRAGLAADLLRDPGLAGKARSVVPAILTPASVAGADEDTTVPDATAIGIDEGFGHLFPGAPPLRLEEWQAAINQALARDLDVRAGDPLVVTLERGGAIPFGTLFAHRGREETRASLRVDVTAILPDEGLGGFRLDPGTAVPRNIFLARGALAAAMGQTGNANALLVEAASASAEDSLARALAARCSLAEYGLRVRPLKRGTFAVQSAGLLLRETEVTATRKAAEALGVPAHPTSITLATAIRRPGGRSLAYAIVAGLPDALVGAMPGSDKAGARSVAGQTGAPPAGTLGGHGMVLNRWAADDLGARAGDPLEIDTLVPAWDGTYRTETHRFVLRGVAEMGGLGAEPGLVPEIAGITDAERVDAWSAPFPVDLHRITPRDDAYWERYRAAPRAFVSLEAARELWRRTEGAGQQEWVTGVLLGLQISGLRLQNAGAPGALPDAAGVRTVPPLAHNAGAGGVRSPWVARSGDRPLREWDRPPREWDRPHGEGALPDRPEPVTADAISRAVVAHLRPADAGLVFRPVRRLVLEASRGSTDFGQLFLAMSFFLVLSAAGLAAMTMRLLAERRAAEMGVLLVCGFRPEQVRRTVLAEGALLAAVGALPGTFLGVLYAAGIVHALTTRWAGAVSSTALWLHVDAGSLWAGALSGLGIGVLAVWWGVRQMTRRPVLELLSGMQNAECRMQNAECRMQNAATGAAGGRPSPVGAAGSRNTQHATRSTLVSAGAGSARRRQRTDRTDQTDPAAPAPTRSGILHSAFCILHSAFCILHSAIPWAVLAGALIALGMGGQVPAAVAFFGGGAALLGAGLGACRGVLRRAVRTAGMPTPARMAVRSAAANPGRSMLVVGLFASAAFVLVATAANQRDVSAGGVNRRDSGAGGFALRAVSALPIPFDFGSAAGRARLGFPPEDEALFRGVEVVPFLAGPGEDISCLNLARPTAPRLLGVPRAMVQRGGFRVKSQTVRPGGNPWRVLEAGAVGGALPAFGDADSVQWTLHSGLGKRYSVPDAGGRPVPLRFAGVLPGSLFAGELLVSEANFRRLFPAVTAPRYFLIATPDGRDEQVAQSLRRNLGEMGLSVRATPEVLNSYRRVQNTYLATFLALGGLGMLLGTLGLVMVLLRGALERRSEFALMLATGFRRQDLSRLLLLENAGLLLAGLAIGLVAALVAVLPALSAAQTKASWGTVAALLAAMLVVGLGSCAAAARAAVRGDLVQALRGE